MGRAAWRLYAPRPASARALRIGGGLRRYPDREVFRYPPSWSTRRADKSPRPSLSQTAPAAPGRRTSLYNIGQLAHYVWPRGQMETEAIANVLGGRKVLGRDVKKPADLAQLVRGGLPAGSVTALAAK